MFTLWIIAEIRMFLNKKKDVDNFNHQMLKENKRLLERGL